MGATPSIHMIPPPNSTSMLKQRSHSMAVDPFAASAFEAAAVAEAASRKMGANSNLRKRRKRDLLDVAVPSDENGVQIQIIQASKLCYDDDN